MSEEIQQKDSVVSVAKKQKAAGVSKEKDAVTPAPVPVAQEGEQPVVAQPTAQDLLKDEVTEVKVRRAKGSKNVHTGVCHILSTYNNTKVVFTDQSGNVISASSAGKCNFRGSRRPTPYAAQVATQAAGRDAMSHGMKEVAVRVKGPGMGRDAAIRTIPAMGFMVTSIMDVTPVPHNGCRPRKRRRV
jgi:small subunit ribosomal protein S11